MSTTSQKQPPSSSTQTQHDPLDHHPLFSSDPPTPFAARPPPPDRTMAALRARGPTAIRNGGPKRWAKESGLCSPSGWAWGACWASAGRARSVGLGPGGPLLGMGMSLTLDDLRGALAMPKDLLSGFILQYSDHDEKWWQILSPLVAQLIAAGGLVLDYVMTAMLTAKLAGQFVAVDAAGLLISTLQMTELSLLFFSCFCLRLPL
ncbi:hypothetical protein Sjap_000674 [Stephania japonica]|uniref:Uncharacterized protein n=1 Tax=Stephania japonica TaxID=461633 RepID=A0AAP0KKR7_9MAGN